MAVYVDNAKIPRYGFLLCHMFADTSEELHKAAHDLRLSRRWYCKGERLEHYTVSMSKRSEAIERGAVAVDSRTFIRERMQRKSA